jgi:ketosteroid isomerase-like protein
MPEEFDKKLQQALDKQDIHDTAMLYPRALDRADVDLILQMFHDDATVEYGLFDGLARDFAPFVIDFVHTLKWSFHSISNEIIVVDGDNAACEFYGTAFMCVDDNGTLTDSIIGGRYLDRWQRRNDEWKISHRQFVMDWNQNQPASAVWDEGLFAALKVRGCRGKEDPLYKLL